MTVEQKHSTSSTAQGSLEGLYRELGITAKDAGGAVRITGADPVTPSVHRIGDAAAAALAALGTEVAALHQERGGAGQDVTVSVDAAVRQLMAVFFTRMRGVPVGQLLEDPNLLGNSDFYRAADGRFVYVLLSYPHLRDIACQVLDCPPDRERISAAVAQWDALPLEEAICERGGTAIAVRTREEWCKHPQGRLLADGPLIRIEKLGQSVPEPFPTADDGLPLAGVRVLDNTHVIAGPIATRITAELGADVLHLSAPSRPDPVGMIVETGIGKRAAFCDLIDPVQTAAFWSTLVGADLYVSNYMNLDTKGFGSEKLVEHRPGLVVLDFHGWGSEGPWLRRGGFDGRHPPAPGNGPMPAATYARSQRFCPGLRPSGRRLLVGHHRAAVRKSTAGVQHFGRHPSVAVFDVHERRQHPDRAQARTKGRPRTRSEHPVTAHWWPKLDSCRRYGPHPPV
ncbi:CoA transferase [Streptomyces sp. NPDC058000]|uniref:CoA transferase n=1 Tax=Streptomyces sp. NPDC058000 TaxID=3346299 RepID=UPI0036F0B30F